MITDVSPATLRRHLARFLFAARWVAAPIYLGLFGALCLLAVKFADKLLTAIPDILTMDTSEAILVALTLIDLALVANLVIMVMFAAWENFVGPMINLEDRERPNGLRAVGFNAVKLKVIASAAAIAVIQMLETFVHISQTPKVDALIQLAVVIAIPVVGVLLALMDKISGPYEG